MESRSAIVLYGSETGTSQDAAEEVGRVLTRLHFVVGVFSLDEVQPVRYGPSCT
jgi:sulfite reductase alpha subunit-like flavoprotein